MNTGNSLLSNIIEVLKYIEARLGTGSHVSMFRGYKALIIRAEWPDGLGFQLVFDEERIEQTYNPDSLIDFFSREANEKRKQYTSRDPKEVTRNEAE